MEHSIYRPTANTTTAVGLRPRNPDDIEARLTSLEAAHTASHVSNSTTASPAATIDLGIGLSPIAVTADTNSRTSVQSQQQTKVVKDKLGRLKIVPDTPSSPQDIPSGLRPNSHAGPSSVAMTIEERLAMLEAREQERIALAQAQDGDRDNGEREEPPAYSPRQ